MLTLFYYIIILCYYIILLKKEGEKLKPTFFDTSNQLSQYLSNHEGRIKVQELKSIEGFFSLVYERSLLHRGAFASRGWNHACNEARQGNRELCNTILRTDCLTRIFTGVSLSLCNAIYYGWLFNWNFYVYGSVALNTPVQLCCIMLEVSRTYIWDNYKHTNIIWMRKIS